MDIRSYFRTASKSSVVSSSSDSDCASTTSKQPSKSGSGIRRYNKKWEETFLWLEFDENLQGAFCKLSLQRTGGLGLPNHSLTRRRQLRK